MLNKLDNFIPEVCIYHNVTTNFPCPDGIASAWVVNRKYPDIKLIGWTYQDCENLIYPDIKEYQNILVVDFSLPVHFLDEHRDKNIVIIDHHDGFNQKILAVKSYNLENFIFNEYECGATLTWKQLFPNEPLPLFLQWVRDRDINLRKFENIEIIHAGMGAIGRTFNLYDQLYENEIYERDNGLEIGKFNYDLLYSPGLKSVTKKNEKMTKYLSRVQFWNNTPLVVLNKSDMYLKTDMANFLFKEFSKSELCLILDKSDNSAIRVRSQSLNLIDIFQKYLIVNGHKQAASFHWKNSIPDLKNFLFNMPELQTYI